MSKPQEPPAEDAAYEKQLKALLKYLHGKVPNKRRKVSGRSVLYFKGNKMVEEILASSFYSEAENPAAPAFIHSKEEAIATCQELLERGHFHRGVYRDVPMISKEKKKIMKRTLFPDEEVQEFADDNVSFIWTYEPASPWLWVGGAVLMLLVLLVVISPIWPDGLGFLQEYGFTFCLYFICAFLLLEVVRLCLFLAVWLLTLGRYHLWLFPRLNEDTSVVESFKPLYTITDSRVAKDKDAKKTTKKAKSQKTSDTAQPASATDGAGGAKDDASESGSPAPAASKSSEETTLPSESLANADGKVKTE